jgi:hypothetical protein
VGNGIPSNTIQKENCPVVVWLENGRIVVTRVTDGDEERERALRRDSMGEVSWGEKRAKRVPA